MHRNGQLHKFSGTVLLMLGDTLAAHDIGGFKVGVGFALRICRHCMATREQSQTKVCRLLLSKVVIIMSTYIVLRGRVSAS